MRDDFRGYAVSLAKQTLADSPVSVSMSGFAAGEVPTLTIRVAMSADNEAVVQRLFNAVMEPAK